MTQREAYVLGWVYGRILRDAPNRGDAYDPTGNKFSQAAANPLVGFALVHDAAIQGNWLTGEIQHDIGGALEEVKAASADATPIPLSIQLRGSWQIGYFHAMGGKALEPDALDIAALRKAKGLTQSELAELCGTTQSVIARWESGSVKPNARNLERIKAVLAQQA